MRAVASPLIEPAELEARLREPGIQVVDCRWELGRPGRGRALYLEGHIPGASFLDVEQDLSDPPGPRGRHPLPDLARFAAAAGAAGIGDGTFVVAYDQNTNGGAARLWWLLRHVGHEEVAVLRGGCAAWGGPTTSGDEAGTARSLTVRVRADDVAEAGALAGRGPGTLLLDARRPERYRGEVEPIDPVAGHIPGARNVPFDESWPVGADVLGAASIVAYCGSGVTACVSLLALAEAGRTDARLYSGSWSEWCALGGPVETGS
jgi:thiosulfate/3-mercaptopyruvate sulfurtransferase